MAAVFQLFFPCLVFVLSRQNGVSGEVPDDVVYTDLNKTLIIGDSVVLKCQFRGTPLAVYWKKGDDPRTAPNLVSWVPTDNVTGLCEGERPCKIMEMNEDFSLIIKEVSIEEQGRYICRVASYKGILIHNFTDISVFFPPRRPFPTIDSCSTGASEPCILTLETGVDSTDLTCRTMGASSGLVSLFWIHGGLAVPYQARQESSNVDGVTWDIRVTTATPSNDPYVCVARLSTTASIEANASITVYAPVVTTPEAFMTTNATSSPPYSGGIQAGGIAGIAVSVILIVVLIVVIKCLKKKREGYRPLKRYHLLDKGKISDYELEKLAEMLEICSLSLLVSELMGESSIRFIDESRDDLHQRLCQWKVESSGDARLLYSAMEKCPLEKDFNKTEAFLASEKDMVSYLDLEHICWHVQRCGETVKPILRSLRFPFKNTEKVAKNSKFSIPSSRIDEIWEDLQMMKSWQGQSVEEACIDEDEDCDETITYRTKSEKASIKDGHTKPLPSNQMIRLCRALEKAGEKTGNSDGEVYRQLSKTFYKIQDEYKRELTDEDLKKFALGITRRHCQRLRKSLGLRERDIDVRNKEDLTVMFRTDIMLKAWVLDQRCSNYEIRCRLRRAAEQCNRRDIADLFISKDQSEIMSSDATLQASLTFTDEKQSPKANAPESNKKENHDNDDLMDTEGTQPTDSGAGSEVSYVTAVSREELKRIGRYAGTDTLIAFLVEYGIGEVPEQQSTEGKELPFETKIISTLKRKLDSVHDEIVRRTFKWINTGDTPRNVLRQFLDKHDKTTPYACLLPRGREDDIFNVELVELAFRLVMADVYPFAKALGINDQLLTHYKPKFGPKNLSQGTVRIIRTDDRLEMVRMLKQAGYLEEAKAIYFGFEIGLGDVVEVENRVDLAQLAQQLCVPDDIQGTGQAEQTINDERQKSVLLQWKDTVRSSTFNQRLVLADALFNMGEEQLALDIISGKYRNRVITNPQSKVLAKTIPEGQLSKLSQVLGQKDKRGQNCQDIITSWASNEKWTKPQKLSNQLFDAGFYTFAHEIMAVGAWRRKDKKEAAKKEPKETVHVANEEMSEEGSSISKEQRAGEGKKDKAGSETPEDKADFEKGAKEDKLRKNTEQKVEGKEEQTESETGEKDAETAEHVEMNGDKTNEDAERQDREEQKPSGKETNGAHNIAAEPDEEDNSTRNASDEDWEVISREDLPQDEGGQEASQEEKNSGDNSVEEQYTHEEGGRPEKSDKSGQERQSETSSTDDGNLDGSSHSQAIALVRS